MARLAEDNLGWPAHLCVPLLWQFGYQFGCQVGAAISALKVARLLLRSAHAACGGDGDEQTLQLLHDDVSAVLTVF